MDQALTSDDGTINLADDELNTRVSEETAENSNNHAPPRPSSTLDVPKPASGGRRGNKKSKRNNGELNEAKERGRKLRSANKRELVMSNQFASLSLDSRANIPQSTGLVYDARLAEYQCLWDPAYTEKPSRVTEPYKRCLHYGLVERCTRVEVRPATEEEIQLEHEADYIDVVKSSAAMDQNALKELSAKFDSMYFHQKSYDCALLCLGGVLDLVNEVAVANMRNGMAIVRPPGHHATSTEACGYCYFNNVAIAAKYAQQKHGVGKILIVDWDVHHGQATQRTFYNDSSVLYISTHRYEEGEFWPNLRESDYDHVGHGKGQGYNVNIPLNATKLGDSDYMAFFNQVIMPIAYEFNPDLVLVSAGYDCALGCPEGEMEVSPATFAHFTQMLMGLADGRVCVIQEGGYCIQSLSEGIAMTLRTLLGEAVPSAPSIGEPQQSAMETILNVITVQRPYWKCFQYQTLTESVFSRENISFKGPKLEDRPETYEIVNCCPVLGEAETHYLEWRLNQLLHETKLLTTPWRTALVYDSRMRLHRNHVNAGHPERPDRITRIYAKHEEYGLVDRCHLVEPRFATKEELETCHPMIYIEEIQALSTMKPRDLHDLEERYDSIYLTQEAFASACLAAGSLLNVVDSVMTGEARNGVAIIRPPGHHAEPKLACGFCFFNSVAVAAKYCRNKYGAERILILDWDIHHGNGTQRIFESESNVLYMSIHRYEDGGFFPGSDYGSWWQVGHGAGEGFTVNVPWAKKGMGDGDYLAAFQQVIMPIAREYNPELVLVSAGFDAARGDPLGGCHVSPTCYAAMTHMLCGLAQGRVVLALEGGYNLSSISEAMTLCSCILLGDPCPLLHYQAPSHSAVRSICDTLDVQKHYWKSLKFRAPIQCTSKLDLNATTCSADLTPSDISTSCTETTATEESSFELDSLADDMKAMSVQETKPDDETFSLPRVQAHSSPKLAHGPARHQFSERPLDGALGERTTVEGAGGNDYRLVVEGAGGEALLPVRAAVNGFHANGVESDAKSGSNGLVKDSQINSCNSALEGACGGAEAPPSGGILIDGMEPEGFVVPLPWCPHLELVNPIPPEGLDVTTPCSECGTRTECWLCLTCYEVFCGRFVNEHMLLHGVTYEHYMVLSYADLSVWCYGCDSYVNNEIVFPMKRAAHIDKFNMDVPCIM